MLSMHSPAFVLCQKCMGVPLLEPSSRAHDNIQALARPCQAQCWHLEHATGQQMLPPRTEVVRTWRVAMSSSLRIWTESGQACSALTSEVEMDSCTRGTSKD